MIIAVDFDGTCVTHEFPKIGKDIGAVPVLKRLVENGHKIILFTMRGNSQSYYKGKIVRMEEVKNKINPVAFSLLDDAEKWFVNNGIELFGVNGNPEQFTWTNSPKPYANIYIDDAALGCPLKVDTSISYRPFVDWEGVQTILEKLEVI